MEETQGLRQRAKENEDPILKKDSYTSTDNDKTTKRDKRMAMAKRGLRSLAIAISLPLTLTILNIYFFGSSHAYAKLSKPIWFPPLWALHLTCMVSTLLMGLSAWLVWADGGFHKKPSTLYLYLAQLGLSLAWDPIVFRVGSSWVGLVDCLALFGALFGCFKVFKEVNPIAGDLLKPCLAWAGFLAVVNFKLALI